MRLVSRSLRQAPVGAGGVGLTAPISQGLGDTVIGHRSFLACPHELKRGCSRTPSPTPL